ncbi:hypothetical protein DFH06DRAFT_1369375 [Mycena polygramma]|nr:hypothetical protein DFH06DRAFT_1369375 [Mycena polygramma]
MTLHAVPLKIPLKAKNPTPAMTICCFVAYYEWPPNAERRMWRTRYASDASIITEHQRIEIKWRMPPPPFLGVNEVVGPAGSTVFPAAPDGNKKYWDTRLPTTRRARRIIEPNAARRHIFLEPSNLTKEEASARRMGPLRPRLLIQRRGPKRPFTACGRLLLRLYEPINAASTIVLVPQLKVGHQDPIHLHLHLTPPPPFGHLRPDHTLVSRWSQDTLGLELPWRTDWFSMYWRWELWQGNPGDIAWVIENTYGFPTSIVPQAYGHPPYNDDVDVLFRSGHRYLVYAINEVDRLKSFPLPLPPQTVFRPGSRDEFHYNEGKNRWRELSERGGRPHKNLLDTASVKPRGRIYHRDYSSGPIP